MFLTFDEYICFGGKLDEMQFTRFEFKAEMIVNLHTHNRLKLCKFVSSKVKMLTFELVSLCEFNETASSTQVSSVGNDGYNESYIAPPTVQQIQEKESNLVHQYLHGEADDSGTPLFYCGR